MKIFSFFHFLFIFLFYLIAELNIEILLFSLIILHWRISKVTAKEGEAGLLFLILNFALLHLIIKF